MLGTSAIKVGGRGWDIEFTLDDQASIAQVEESLREYLRDTRGWYDGALITVDVGRRMLSPHELCGLKQFLEEEFHIRIGSLKCKAETLEESLSKETGLPITLSLNGQEHTGNGGAYLQETTRLVRGTCRSGTTIRHRGDLVIFGDVNPGAEVIATGDVLVFGTLRGMAHSGVNGLDPLRAVIIALSMQPTQLRIGPQLALSPIEGRGTASSLYAEMAYVSGSTIVVVPYKGRFHWEEEESTL